MYKFREREKVCCEKSLPAAHVEKTQHFFAAAVAQKC